MRLPASLKSLPIAILVLLFATGFTSVQKTGKSISPAMASQSFIMEKVFTETIVHYNNAKRNNREPVYVTICITDAQGNLYADFGPKDAELFTNLWNPTGILEHVEIKEFVTQGTSGYYGIVVQPGKTDKWRKGVYIFGFRIKNATHQCAGMARLDF